MCKKLPVDNFKWVDQLSMFTDDFIKNYDEESDIGYLFVVDVEYPKNLDMLHSDLPFLPERMKINKCTKLVYNLQYLTVSNLSYTYISIKTSIKSWFNIKQGT